ncbi:uncharacterized protein N7503_002367 [Penicillium pulvis]|uniref:uncharacterized protein n=1 Tax=Penicillium pulvis TaxID=1562058 RepID=UPI002547092F|nr:uncharacterized protein N7503_002367 [Penicillium pulvis]KAJ5810149.1 hypothetical protein N7503_002367 [Penicillium pulvis]
MSSVQHVQRTSPPYRAPRPRYYSRQTNIQPSRDSTIPPLSQENSNSSDLFYSDEKSIFNAVRVSTPNEDSRPYEIPYIMERGRAANMARLIPPGSQGSSQDSHSATQHRRLFKSRQRADQLGWRNQLFSDNGAYHTSQLGLSPLNEGDYLPESAGNQHRKAMSLDAVDDHSSNSPRKHPCWPGSGMPTAVRTVQPTYPPPERLPTPPGLPSFNTPEAMYCSAQFLIGHNGPRGLPSHRPHGVSATGQRSSSYGDAFRRFLGLQPTVETDPVVSGSIGIGRAPDGTIVQGRFPQRQSGHGTNLARQIEDHPFHQNTLRVAPTSQASPNLVRNSTQADSSASKRYPDSQPRKKKVRTMGLGILGRSLIPASVPVQRAQHEPITSPISPLQLPQPRYDLIRTPSDRRSEDQVLSAGTYTVCDILAWLPIQLYLCCCFKRLSVEDDDDLEIINSRETYATARSRFSGVETDGSRVGPSP